MKSFLLSALFFAVSAEAHVDYVFVCGEGNNFFYVSQESDGKIYSFEGNFGRIGVTPPIEIPSKITTRVAGGKCLISLEREMAGGNRTMNFEFPMGNHSQLRLTGMGGLTEGQAGCTIQSGYEAKLSKCQAPSLEDAPKKILNYRNYDCAYDKVGVRLIDGRANGLSIARACFSGVDCAWKDKKHPPPPRSQSPRDFTTTVACLPVNGSCSSIPFDTCDNDKGLSEVDKNAADERHRSGGIR